MVRTPAQMHLLIRLTNEKMYFNLTHENWKIESREQPNIVLKEWPTKLGKQQTDENFRLHFRF